MARAEEKNLQFAERYAFKGHSQFANREYKQGQALEQMRNFDFAEMERRVIANMAAAGYDLTTRVHDELCFEKRPRKKLRSLSVKLLMRWADEFYTTSKDLRVRTIGHGQMEVQRPLTPEEQSLAFLANSWLDGDVHGFETGRFSGAHPNKANEPKYIDGGRCSICGGDWIGAPQCPNCQPLG